jgi:hypothetical protein
MQIPHFSGSFKVDMAAMERKYDMPFGDQSALATKKAANSEAERLHRLAAPYQGAIKDLPFDLVYTGEGPRFNSLYVPFKARIEIRKEGTTETLHRLTPDEGYQPYRAARWEKILSRITLGLFKDYENNLPARKPETEDAFISRAVEEAEELDTELQKAKQFL